MGKKRKPKFVSPIKKGQYLLLSYVSQSTPMSLLKCIKPIGIDHMGRGTIIGGNDKGLEYPIWPALINNGKILTEEEAKLWLLQESMK